MGLLALAFALARVPVWAGYKARPWNVEARERYSASLTSEGVTIAVEPLFADALAAPVFDKSDILTRGIMPLTIVIFNDNDFPVEVDGLTIELIHEKEHIRTMSPSEVVHRLVRKDKTWDPQPVPRMSRSDLNPDALDDFSSKFLMAKVVAPHDKAGGFLYLHVGNSSDLASYLASSVICIPDIYRRDNGSRMIFFEIGLKGGITPGSHG